MKCLNFSLDSPFLILPFAGQCSDFAHPHIITFEECNLTASKLSIDFYDSKEDDSSYPIGCYVYGIDSPTVYFNENKDGRAEAESRPICKPIGES